MGYFIDTNGVDLAQLPVFLTPGNNIADGSKTLSQEVRTASAVPFHESRRA
ncbi:MAG TPA: hypothetical protein VMZ52_18340 [Bryobacteraceae bacterium]|nr:hypothetical protein [Bryobacteraceae bacterium]